MWCKLLEIRISHGVLGGTSCTGFARNVTFLNLSSPRPVPSFRGQTRNVHKHGVVERGLNTVGVGLCGCVSRSLLPANSRVSNCQEEGFWKWEEVRLGFNILASFVSGKATWRTGHTHTLTHVYLLLLALQVVFFPFGKVSHSSCSKIPALHWRDGKVLSGFSSRE